MQAEISSLGGVNPAAVPGGVAFGGGWEVCYRVNLWSRIASRVLWQIHAFSYANETDIFEKTKKFDWPRALGDKQVKAVTKYRRGRRVTWVARVRPGAA